MSNENLKDLTTQVRRDILRMVHKVNSEKAIVSIVLLVSMSSSKHSWEYLEKIDSNYDL